MVMPEWVMPSQFFNQSTVDTPEKKLMMMVLLDAIQIMQRPLSVSTARNPAYRIAFEKNRLTPRQETRAWFASDDRTWPFAFLNLCDVFDLDPSCIRRIILEKPQERIRPRSHLAGVRTKVRGRLIGNDAA